MDTPRLAPPAGLRAWAGATIPTAAARPPAEPATLRRSGTIVVRAYPAALGLCERDIQELHQLGAQLGALTWTRLAKPDARWLERRLDNLCVDRQEFHNVACNAGRTFILTYIGNLIVSGNLASFPGANVFAVGNGGATPASTDTQLSAELFRKQTSSATVSGNSVDINTFFATTEANYTYTEAGIFAVTGTPPGAANTGTLFAHASYSYTKTSSISLTNDYFVYEN